MNIYCVYHSVYMHCIVQRRDSARYSRVLSLCCCAMSSHQYNHITLAFALSTYTHMYSVFVNRDGFYDAFYPPVDQLDAQLAVRTAAELKNTVAPFTNQQPGSYYYNPVKQNIWVSAQSLMLHTVL